MASGELNLTSLRSQERTVLSSPPVHSLVPSGEMSIQLAPSVCPWNCRTKVWLWRSQTAMLPSLQQLKQTLESGLIARAQHAGALEVSSALMRGVGYIMIKKIGSLTPFFLRQKSSKRHYIITCILSACGVLRRGSEGDHDI